MSNEFRFIDIAYCINGPEGPMEGVITVSVNGDLIQDIRGWKHEKEEDKEERRGRGRRVSSKDLQMR